MTIVAIVVTHNRIKKLQTCLNHLIKAKVQPDTILVINNASTDGTHVFLKNFSKAHSQVTAIDLTTNIGGAGGFELGMREAYQQGASHFWLMDDDCFVEPTALQALMNKFNLLSQSSSNPIGFLCSKVNWIDGTVCEMNQPCVNWDYLRQFNSEQLILKVIGASFVSCLITREAVDTVGFPIGKLFIWFDDAEYTRRISSQFDCYCILDSQVIHATQNNEGVWFGNIDQYNFVKFCYGARNESWYRFHKENLIEWSYFIINRCKEMKIGNVKWSHRCKIFWQFIVGVFTDF